MSNIAMRLKQEPEVVIFFNEEADLVYTFGPLRTTPTLENSKGLAITSGGRDGANIPFKQFGQGIPNIEYFPNTKEAYYYASISINDVMLDFGEDESYQKAKTMIENWLEYHMPNTNNND